MTTSPHPQLHPERVRLSIDHRGIAEVALVRADKMNALDAAMIESITAALAALRAAPGLRAVLLHGEGRAFCAGLDMARFAQIAEHGAAGLDDLGARTHGLANWAQHIVLGWRELPVPVIAAVHGLAFGGGLQLALGADVRLVHADTRMSVMEIKWGLVPDMAGTVLLRGLVRDDHARELVFTGREVRGEEAVRLGLATRICADPLAEARELAAGLAARSPSALRAAKRLLNAASGTLDAGAATLLQAESDEQAVLLGAPEQQEAVRANLEKRAPRFVDNV